MDVPGRFPRPARNQSSERRIADKGRKGGIFGIADTTGARDAGNMPARSVLICLFDQVQSLDVTGPLEVFAGANTYFGHEMYRISTASPGGRVVRTSSGLAITPDADLDTSKAPHTLVVPGGEGTRSPD